MVQSVFNANFTEKRALEISLQTKVLSKRVKFKPDDDSKVGDRKPLKSSLGTLNSIPFWLVAVKTQYLSTWKCGAYG